ncbi:MAG TPA: RNA polymerase sigma factor [Steroidobacteraceae bacterium]|jgi:RNA polymerase sigma-70 factor (ECF subfamily)
MGTVHVMQARGNSAEFVSRLTRSHGAALQRFLERMLGRKDLAEDVAQEAYLKLYRLSRPDEVNCPRALLFDVAAKLAIDRLRQQRAEAAMTAAAAEMNDMADETSRPERRAALDEAMQRLTRIIEELQPNLRQVFVMRFVTQMPRQQIADQLHISVGAVEQRLTRALMHCRERLTAHGIDWLGLD